MHVPNKILKLHNSAKSVHETDSKKCRVFINYMYLLELTVSFTAKIPKSTFCKFSGGNPLNYIHLHSAYPRGGLGV